LVRYNNLKNKENELLEQARIQALGAHYRFTKLENERLKLKTKLQKNKLVSGGVFLIFSILVIAILNKLKQKKLEKEILTLKNIAIEDQIVNLLHSLEISEEKNVELIELAEELESKYLDSKEISEFSHKIDKNNIASWLEFENHFSNLRPEWEELLKEKAPGLSPADIKYCLCIAVNLNNFEISKLLNVGESAVKSAKKRIRDKLALKKSTDIYAFLKNLTN
jgi:DNA-binding CsgD family transcriptional regulator